MNRMLLVLLHELRTNLQRKSFLLTTFGVPLLAGLIMLAASGLGSQSATTTPTPPGDGSPQAQVEPQLKVEGYVDPAGLVREVPEGIPPGTLLPYDTEAQAKEALQAGQISAYYLISPDYVASGELIYVSPDYRFGGYGGQSWVMANTLAANLLGHGPERLERFWVPMDLEVQALSPEERESVPYSPLAFYIPYGTMMIFYFVIIMAASLLLNSIAEEKKNRVLEQLLVSVTPRQILGGKILGLGIVGLIQTVAWVGTGYALLKLSGRSVQLPPGMELPPSILFWGLIFFLLGYAIYASLMAGLGALAPNLKEASQAVLMVLWPLILPLFAIAILIEEPNGALAVILSLFPLTAPTTMMLRLAATTVPLWQPLLAAALMLGSAVLIVRAVAGIFRAQHMLSGQPFSPKRFLTVLLGRT